MKTLYFSEINQMRSQFYSINIKNALGRMGLAAIFLLSGLLANAATTLTVGNGTSDTIKVSAYYDVLNVSTGGKLIIQAPAVLTIGAVGTSTSITSATFSNASVVQIDSAATLVVNGSLQNKNNSTGITINGTLIVNGDLSNGNGGGTATISGSGSVSATGTITNSGGGTVFGSGSSCATGPCNTCSPITNTISAQSTTVCSGAPLGTLSGSPVSNSTYQWAISTNSSIVGFINISGATSQDYTPVPTISGNTYFIRYVSSGTCTYISNVLTFTTANTLNVTTHPSNLTACTSGSASFSVVVSGPSPMYQWWDNLGVLSNTGVYSGVNTSTLSISNDAGLSGKTYKCVITSGCATTVTSNSATLTVSGTAPVISAQPSNKIICSAANTSFAVTATNTPTYQWQVNAGSGFVNLTNTAPYSTVTSSSLTLTGATTAITGYTYRCVISKSGCSIFSNTATLTVNTLPSVSAGGTMTAICQSGTSTVLGGVYGGSATSAVWSGGTGSFSNNVGSTPNTAAYTAGASESGSVILTITTSGGSCGTKNATKSITINSNPAVSVGGATGSICQSSTSAALGGSFSGGATSAVWSGGAGTFANNTGATPNTATYTASAGESGSITLTLKSGGGSCGTVNAAKTITVITNVANQTTWTGNTNTDWATGTNWACGGIPSSIKNVVIPAGLTKYPLIGALANSNSINIANGGFLSISGTNTLNVFGSWVNNGTFIPNSSSVVFTGTTATSISGSDTTNFYDLKVNKTSAATLTVSSIVTLQNILSFGTTAVNTLAINNAGGGSFTFLSTSGSTAHIDQLSTVTKPLFSGNFTCQKYFPEQIGRFNFLLGIPVTNGFMNAVQATTFDPSGYPTNGFLVSGPFTGTSTGTGLNLTANSSFKYDPSTGIYKGCPAYGDNIATTPLTIGQGYRFSVRDKAAVTSIVAKTLSVSGTLPPAGSFTFPGWAYVSTTKPFSSNTSPSSLAGGWNLVSNPYMSDISINLVDTIGAAAKWTKTRVSNTAYIYNANARTYSSCAAGVGTCIVPAFQGFFVQGKSGGAAALKINESAKVTGTNNSAVHRFGYSPVLNYLPITLSSSVSVNVNQTYIRYTEGANARLDGYDGFKLGAAKRTYLSDVGVYSEGLDQIYYDVNAKSNRFVSDTTELVIITPVGNATLDFSDTKNLENGYKISLYDKYNHILTDLIQNPIYEFAVTADSNSTGSRFQVIFNNNITTGVSEQLSGNVSIDLYPNPATASTAKLTIANYKGKVEVKVYDLFGNIISSQQAEVNQQAFIPLVLSNAVRGVYTVKVTGDNLNVAKKLVVN